MTPSRGPSTDLQRQVRSSRSVPRRHYVFNILNIFNILNTKKKMVCPDDAAPACAARMGRPTLAEQSVAAELGNLPPAHRFRRRRPGDPFHSH
jgi:hypothetical protein